MREGGIQPLQPEGFHPAQLDERIHIHRDGLRCGAPHAIRGIDSPGRDGGNFVTFLVHRMFAQALDLHRHEGSRADVQREKFVGNLREERFRKMQSRRGRSGGA